MPVTLSQPRKSAKASKKPPMLRKKQVMAMGVISNYKSVGKILNSLRQSPRGLMTFAEERNFMLT